MNIKATESTDLNVWVFFGSAILIIMVLTALTIGLGWFTVHLADATALTPSESMKEFITGFGTLIVGLVTIISIGGTLIVLFTSIGVYLSEIEEILKIKKEKNGK